ncbi:MAG: FGGY-family carbohydrate kinase [Clostridiales bacterium]|nr:FGGY-family carbohydrate kinase [Candidatus Blautia equi]
MSFLLGIDIGTSACKVSVFHKNGAVVASVTRSYQVYYPHPGWVEQSPEEWWLEVTKAIPAVLEKAALTPSDIACIGIVGQSWSAIAIDRDGDVLLPTPIWMDTRSASICQRLNAEIGEDAILSLSGNPLQPSYTTGKILWYREEYPHLYKKMAKILQSNSFIAYRLTGVLSHDLSQGYGVHCYDMANSRWDASMAQALGIDISLLPDLFSCHQVVGTVTEEAAKVCGLISGIPVVAGGLDAACGTLGCGVLHVGETQEQGGQAGGMSICTDSPKGDPRLILSNHVVPDLWLLQGGTVGGGGVMKWIDENLGDYERLIGERTGKRSMQLLDEEAAAVAPGSDGLIFLPYMAGERSPIWDPDAKGVFFGLDYSKTKGHLIRSALEGTAFALKHNLDVAESVGARVDVLRSMGGAANSLLWTQIKSDVTGKKIVVPSADTATSLGVVMLAGVGVGIYSSFEEAVKLTVHEERFHAPDEALYPVYEENYQKYLALYQAVKNL